MRVGLLPIARPAYPGVEPEASERLETAEIRALRNADFDIVGSDSYSKAYDRLNIAAGGIFDPMTGAVRENVSKDVYQNAVKEFFAQEHLGCIGVLRVVQVMAVDDGSVATWDGAVEAFDGQSPITLARLLVDKSASKGKAGAISVIFQLYSRDNKLLYGRAGGVQLSVYYAPRFGAQNSGLLSVPHAKLLLDERRIERALTFATVPLRYSALQIVAGYNNPAINTRAIPPSSLARPPLGIVPVPESPLLVPREQIMSSVHRVVLGPLSLNGFYQPDETALRYQSLVQERLAKLGWNVIASDSLNLDASDAVRIVGGIYNPLTGKVDPDKLRSSNEVLLKRLSQRASPDAVVYISLARVSAIQKFGNAAWDGVEQNAQTLGPVIHRSKRLGGTETADAGEATMPAVSLHLLMRDTNGVTLYEKRGGIELLQKMSLTLIGTHFDQRFANVSASDLFKDSERDVRAVDIALHELLISP